MGKAVSVPDPNIDALRRTGLRVIFAWLDDAPYARAEGIVVLSTAYPRAAALALQEVAPRAKRLRRLG